MRKVALAGLLAGLWLWSKRPGSRPVLPGQVVVVTGGSRGLGLLLARGFARKGAFIVLVARDASELLLAKRRLEREEGARVQALSEDLEDPESGERIVASVLDRFGRIDILVNDAGMISVGPQKAMSADDYRHAMETNFGAAVRITRAALPHLEKSSGSILNITSIGGAVPIPHLLPSTASKFAMTGWSAGLAAELANNGVRVTTVLPWLMRTGSFLHAEVKGRQQKEARNFTLGSTLPLVAMSPERAAARMLLAVERGERFVTVGAPAKLARLAFALMPSLSIAALSLTNRFLPHMKSGRDVAGADAPAEPLWKHRSGIANSFLTRLGDRAARKNNETVHLTDQESPL